MSDDEDEDKPTVVLDFAALKEDLNQSEELTQSRLDIQFNVNFSDDDGIDDESVESSIHQKSLYLFEYKTNYFKKVLPHALNNPNMHLINDLKSLNTALTEDPNSIIIFYYNAVPKAVNQLCQQIRKKFKEAKTVIIAKNLSQQKADQHASSKYAANAYINHPFELSDFYQKINRLEFE